MDSADSSASTPTLATLAAMLERHEQMFIHLRGELANLTQAVAQQTPLPATPPAAAPLQEASASASLRFGSSFPHIPTVCQPDRDTYA
ncbi:unnamed protein product [Oreochromis niloticus]|nr:unnamed protein product [Mustela putorius furo]